MGEGGHRSAGRLVVLASGSGTNLQALIDAIATGRLEAQVSAVFTNRKAAGARRRAQQADIPTELWRLGPYLEAGRDRGQYDADLASAVAAHRPDLVVLAGWLHILGPRFLDRFPGRVLNLHPALPGRFAGLDAIGRAFRAWQRGEITHSGVMVHRAALEVDAGPVLVQAEVPFAPGDDLAAFEARIHACEHRLLVQAVQLALGALPGHCEDAAPGATHREKP